jgi:hypothetical protein
MKHFVELLHERSSRRDRIVLEVLLTVSHISVAIETFDVFLILLGTAESSRALVVHLAPGSHSVESHNDHLGGLEHRDDGVDIVEDLYPHFLEFFWHELRFEDYRIVLSQHSSTLTHL